MSHNVHFIPSWKIRKLFSEIEELEQRAPKQVYDDPLFKFLTWNSPTFYAVCVIAVVIAAVIGW